MNSNPQKHVTKVVEQLTSDVVEPHLAKCDRDGATPAEVAQATGLKDRMTRYCLDLAVSRGAAFKALRTKGPGRVRWVYVSMKHAGAGTGSPLPESGWVEVES